MRPLVLSLEPPPPAARDSQPPDLFARPPRLVDINLDDGSHVYSRDDPKKSLQDRLMRIWQERGDFSVLTKESILAPQNVDMVADEGASVDEKDERPTPEEIRDHRFAVMQQIEVARSELTTALDLLTVISPATDPPTVDPATLPLAHETLAITPSRRLPPSSDPAENVLANLPLAISLDCLKSSATTLFHASEALLPPDPAPAGGSQLKRSKRSSTSTDPWPSLLHLAHSTAYPILPLGARRGATLTGKTSDGAAREVGLFYGAAEAKEEFRRRAVIPASEVMSGLGKQQQQDKKKSLTLSVEVNMLGLVEKAHWVIETGDGMEALLKEKGQQIFAEELFSTISNEARGEKAINATFETGVVMSSDVVRTESYGWSLAIQKFTIQRQNPVDDQDKHVNRLASSMLAFLRLLLLREYADRRRSTASSSSLTLSGPHSAWTRPILGVASTLLSHQYRRRAIEAVLHKVAAEATNAVVEIEFQDGGCDHSWADGMKRALANDTELAGLALLRMSRSRVYFVAFTTPFPSMPAPPYVAVNNAPPPLTLQGPGSAPFAIPSLTQLEAFLREEIVGKRMSMK